jgi:microcystin-dependent protein
LTPMNSGVVVAAGAGAPHDNMQPSLTLNFMMASLGYYPPRPN